MHVTNHHQMSTTYSIHFLTLWKNKDTLFLLAEFTILSCKLYAFIVRQHRMYKL